MRQTTPKNQGRATMPIVTWDHVHLRSPDPEATAAWLEDILGGVILRGPGRIDVRPGGAQGGVAPAARGGGGAGRGAPTVSTAPAPPGAGVNPPPVTPYQGLDHFGLTVSGIDAVVAELKAQGAQSPRDPTPQRPA